MQITDKNLIEFKIYVEMRDHCLQVQSRTLWIPSTPSLTGSQELTLAAMDHQSKLQNTSYKTACR